MPIKSAVDAISPAFARMKLVLFTPFELRRTWKIAATGYVSHTFGTVFAPFPLLVLYFLPLLRKSSPAWVPWAVGVGVILLTALLAFIFILCSRLQFVFFDFIVNRSQFVRPEWRRHREHARPWTMLKLVVGAVLTLVPGSLIAWFIVYVTSSSPTTAPKPFGSIHNPAAFFAFAILFYFVFYGSLLLAVLTAALLNDFSLPAIALEGASPADALRRAVQIIRSEPGPVAIYVLLFIAVGFAAQMAAAIVLEIVLFGAMAIAFFVTVVPGSLFHTGAWIHVLFFVSMLAIYLFTMIFLAPLCMGVATTFTESYKLYFLSGRYPLLAELLERSTPPPAMPAWPTPPPPALPQT